MMDQVRFTQRKHTKSPHQKTKMQLFHFSRASAMKPVSKHLALSYLLTAACQAFLIAHVAGQVAANSAKGKPLVDSAYHEVALTTPEKKAAAGATLLGYTGQPAQIRMTEDGPMVVTRQGRSRYTGNADVENISLAVMEQTDRYGLFNPALFQETCRSVFAVHDSGYVLTESRTLEGGKYVKLSPWQTYSAKVHLNKLPLKSGIVIARWESFPHHSSILSLHPNVRKIGPALFTFEAAAAVVDGKFSFPKLPAGNVQFMVLSDLTVQDESIWKSSSNLVWWGASGEARSDGRGDASVFFDTFTVTGQIKPTDEFQSRRVDLTRLNSTGELRLLDVQVSFWPMSSGNATPSNDRSATLSLGEAISEANQWDEKRRGAKGVEDFYPGSKAILDSENRFVLTLLNKGLYAGEAFLQDETFPDTFGGLSEMIASADSAKAGVRHRLDLGVIDLAGKLNDFRRVSADSLSAARRKVHWEELKARQKTLLPNKAGSDRSSQPPLFNVDLLFSKDKRQTDEVPSSRTISLFPEDESAQLLENKFSERQADALTVRARKADASPVDKAIAELVTGLLSAGDARTRANLKKPLQTLLEQKFDAEQQARESIVGELQKRLKNAEQKVQERATNKAAIVQQQLQRMMGLPEDGFLEMSPVENDRPFGDLSSNSDAELALNHLGQFTYPVPFQCDFTTVDQGGTPLRFLDYNGQTRLIYFWSLSDTSKLQLPALVKLQSKYEKYGFQIIGLHTSSSNDPSANHQLLREAIATAKINFPLGLMADATQQQVPGIYKNPEPPELLFIDDNNEVRLKVNGVKSDEYLAEVVEALLKEATIERLKKADPLRGRDPLRR